MKTKEEIEKEIESLKQKLQDADGGIFEVLLAKIVVLEWVLLG